jgi:hypothetical protein
MIWVVEHVNGEGEWEEWSAHSSYRAAVKSRRRLIDLLGPSIPGVERMCRIRIENPGWPLRYQRS